MLKTREEWLNLAMTKLQEQVFVAHKLPSNIRVSCGFPSARAFSARKQRIGECWSDKASGDKTFEIFISPVLAKSVDVLDCLAHECIHALVGIEAGHKGPFKRVMKEIGLVGKPTATKAGDALKATLEAIVQDLGEYPHATLSHSSRKKDGTRLIKISCGDCGYIARTTQKWVDIGLPTCPCGNEMQLS